MTKKLLKHMKFWNGKWGEQEKKGQVTENQATGAAAPKILLVVTLPRPRSSGKPQVYLTSNVDRQ